MTGAMAAMATIGRLRPAQGRHHPSPFLPGRAALAGRRVRPHPRQGNPIENAQYQTDLPPQLVLSEGQMAANGFSILCAASTAYRWSRWRALLLDDPLQHNDIIHAAAFVDVMRNLVEIGGYQLLMSSHKRDEGEFIARKFDAAGLPCTVVELTAVSKDGVRSAPPRHNAVARRLLNGPEARFGTPAV